MTIKTNLADRTNYGTVRDINAIKYIVVHYTGNDGDTDESNANYFHNNKNLQVSAHYFVDDDSVTQSVPDNFVAWHCGAVKPDTSKGGGTFYDKCSNSNSIGVELCDCQKNGAYNLTEATRKNAVSFIKTLADTYKIPCENVIRHWDVTGKNCPAYWAKTDCEDWEKFKGEIFKTDKIYRVQVGAFASKENALNYLEKAKKDGYNGYVTEV